MASVVGISAALVCPALMQPKPQTIPGAAQGGAIISGSASFRTQFVGERVASVVAAEFAEQGRRGRSAFAVAAASVNAGSPDTFSTSQNRQISETVTRVACGLCAALTVASALPSFASNSKQARLPPLSTDPTRCAKAFDGNTIGQANGVANVLLDLRHCDYTNDVTNLKGKTLSAALMADAKFDGADLSYVIMSKAYAVGASFKGTNFKNAVVDRVAFDKSDMRGVQFINTVLSGSTFEGANLEDASFKDALIGYVDIKKLCLNPTLSDTNKEDLGCK